MAPDRRGLDESINPPHYKKKGGIETIDYIVECTRGIPGEEAVFVANAIKYVSRYREKNTEKPEEDIAKAQWYLARLHNLLVAKSVEEDQRQLQFNLVRGGL